MTNRVRPQYEASRLARWILDDIGRELRLSRRTSGMRQRDVARLTSTSTSHVCRVEHGQVATLSIRELARHAAAVGLKPYVKLFPLARRLLGRPQLQLLGRFRNRLNSVWSWETEVPIPREGDLRSCDCVIRIPECTILVEAYTRFADYQAQTASAMRKKRDLPADRLIILVAATRANRTAVDEAAGVAAGSYSLAPRSTLRALLEGTDPGTDSILFL